MEFLEIDGNLGEGGGSILRLAAGFSVLMNQPIKIDNIRGTRKPPGLRLQHLLGLQTLEKITNGKLSESAVGTTSLTLVPGSDFESKLEVQIRTAGSIALFSQTIQNAFISSRNTRLKISIIGGGTFGLGAPDPYYLNDITYYYFNQMGYRCSVSNIKNGFYPKGGAGAELIIQPVKNPSKELKPLQLKNTGNIKKIGGTIVVSDNLRKPRVLERIYASIMSNLLNNRLNIPDHQNDSYYEAQISEKMFKIKKFYVNALNPGVGLNIWAEYDSGVRVGSGTILGKRGLPSEKVGKMAVESLVKQIVSGATVDEYLADQIIPLLYLCRESCSIVVPEITSHMKTNIDILNMFKNRDYEIKELQNAYSFSYL